MNRLAEIAPVIYFALVALFGVTAFVALAFAWMLFAVRDAVNDAAKEAERLARAARESLHDADGITEAWENAEKAHYLELEKAHRAHAARLNRIFTRATIFPPKPKERAR